MCCGNKAFCCDFLLAPILLFPRPMCAQGVAAGEGCSPSRCPLPFPSSPRLSGAVSAALPPCGNRAAQRHPRGKVYENLR